MSVLKAPFPYYGGKSTVAALVWERFGQPANYVEPFFGSGAVLLARPHAPQTETVNDLDGLLVNFWRALQANPEAVAQYADWPVSEIDLHARHLWLLDRKADVERLIADPDWYDTKIAGWWVWGLCAWIGSGWCSGRGPWRLVEGQLTKGDGAGVELPRPHLGNAGQGINRQLPHLGDAGQGINRAPHPEGIERKRPPLMTDGKGVHAQGVRRKLLHLGGESGGQGIHRTSLAADGLTDYFAKLADRLRRVRITCGDWTRVLGPSVTTKHGLTAVFLDPPYSHQERDDDLYRVDHDIAADVRAWAIAHGDDPLLRIALCGYAGEHDMPEGWTAVRWKAAGGYGSQGETRGRANAAREVIWFSRHCLPPAVQRPTLFDLASVEAAGD